MFRIIKYFHSIVKKRLYNSDARANMVRKNISRMILNKGLSIILSFLNVPIFLKCLDNTKYGIWITIFSLVNWIGFLDIGLGQGLRNKLAEEIAQNNIKKAKELVSTTYFFVAIVFFLIAILISTLSAFVDWSSLFNTPENLKQDVHITFVVVVVLMCLTFVFRILDSVSLAMQATAITSDLLLASQFLSLMAVYMVSKTISNPSLILLGMIMAGIPILVYICFSLYHYRHKFQEISPNIRSIKPIYIKELLSIGTLFFIIQLCGIILTQSGNIIITNISSPEDVPEYYIANKYFNILMMFFMIVTTPYWSATTEAYIKKEFTWIKKNFLFLLKVFAFAMAIGILMLLLSPYLIQVWTGGKISVRVSMALASFILVSLYMLSNIFITFINGMGKIRMQLFVTVAMSLLFIPAAIIFGIKWGSIGVVAVSVLVYFLVTLWASVQFFKLASNSADGIWNK